MTLKALNGSKYDTRDQSDIGGLPIKRRGPFDHALDRFAILLECEIGVSGVCVLGAFKMFMQRTQRSNGMSDRWFMLGTLEYEPRLKL